MKQLTLWGSGARILQLLAVTRKETRLMRDSVVRFVMSPRNRQ